MSTNTSDLLRLKELASILNTVSAGYISVEQAEAIYAVRKALPAVLDELEAFKKKLVEPDYCYDPEDWEITVDWADRDEVLEYGSGLNVGEAKRIRTVIEGPDKWVASVPVTFDDDGDPDDTEIRWFDSEADALAAIAATRSLSGGTEA